MIEWFKSVLSNSHVITVPYNSIMESWHRECLKWGLNKELNIINQRSLDKVEHSPDLLVIDEIHSLSEYQMECIKKIQPKRIIGLSGTLSDVSKAILKSELGLNVIFEYTIEQAVRDSIISNYEINVVNLPLDNKDRYIKAGNKQKRFYTTEQGQYNYLTKQFNRFKFASFNDESLTPVKFKYAGQRSRLIYGAKSKIELVKKIIRQFKNERKLIFTTLTATADNLSKYSHHSKSDDNLSRFIDKEIDELAVCNMVDMGKLMPL